MSIGDKALYILQPTESVREMIYGGPQWIRKWHRINRQVSSRTSGCSMVTSAVSSEEMTRAWVDLKAIDDYRIPLILKDFPAGTPLGELEAWADGVLCRLGAISVPDSDSWRDDGLMAKLWDQAWMQGVRGAESLDAVTVSSVTTLLRTLRQAALEERLPYHIPHVGLQLQDKEVAVLEWSHGVRDLTLHVLGADAVWIYSESTRVSEMEDGVLTPSDLPALRGLWRKLLQDTSDQVHSFQEESAS